MDAQPDTATRRGQRRTFGPDKRKMFYACQTEAALCRSEFRHKDFNRFGMAISVLKHPSEEKKGDDNPSEKKAQITG